MLFLYFLINVYDCIEKEKMLTYESCFYRLSRPIIKVVCDNNAIKTILRVTHKQLTHWMFAQVQS